MHEPLVSPTRCVCESPPDLFVDRSEDIGQSLVHDGMPSKLEPFSENPSRLPSGPNVSTGLPSVVAVGERLLESGANFGISKVTGAPLNFLPY